MKLFKFFILFVMAGAVFARAEGLTVLELTPALSEFRRAACMNPEKAFEDFSASKAAQKLQRLGKTLCPVSEPEDGWVFFFGTSVGALNSLSEESILALFYNPWSDVGLLTEWRKRGKKPQIVDAELVTGDVLRATENPVLTPVWRREGDVPPPLEVLVSTSETLKAFMELYVDANESDNPDDWRGRLPNFSSEEQREGHHQAVGFFMTQALSAMNVFFTEDAFNPIESKMAEVRGLLLEENVAQVLQMAKETPKETQKILRELPLDWSRATLVSVATDAKNTFVFLSSFENPEYFASFWFENGGKGFLGMKKEPSIRRIDLLGHTLSFDQIEEIKKDAKIAGK